MKTGFVISLLPTPPSAPFLFSGRLEEGLKAAAQMGFQGVELNILDPGAEDGPALRALLRGYGLEMCTIATGQAYGRHGLSLSHLDADIRRRALERLRSHAELATLLESPVTVGLIRGILSGDAGQQAEGRARALEGLHSFAAYASTLGVTVYLEALNRYECNFVNTVAEGLQTLQEIGASNLYLLADVFHMNIEEVDMGASLLGAGKRLGYVHFADSNRWAPGNGHTDFAPILRALRQIGYNRYVTVEICPRPDDLTAAQRSAEFLQRHLS